MIRTEYIGLFEDNNGKFYDIDKHTTVNAFKDIHGNKIFRDGFSEYTASCGLGKEREAGIDVNCKNENCYVTLDGVELNRVQVILPQ